MGACALCDPSLVKPLGILNFFIDFIHIYIFLEIVMKQKLIHSSGENIYYLLIEVIIRNLKYRHLKPVLCY